jgi:EAL domain-containing protein (putative c-di-GMP-specific phosphodiesterase class I)/GGDEF domain-containing protein
MPAIFRHIRTRMLVSSLLLLSLVLGVVLYAVYRAGLADAEARAEVRLNLAGAAFAQFMAQRATFLQQGVEALAADPAFAQDLQKADLAALESALGSHAGRFRADMAMLVSLDGRFLVNTRFPDVFGQPFPNMRMLRLAEQKGGAAGYVRMHDQAYQVVLAPASSPQQVAWVALGFPVSDTTATNLQALTGTGVDIFNVGDEGVRVLASSFAGEMRMSMMNWLSGIKGMDTALQRARIGGQPFWVHFMRLDTAAPDYAAALTLPMETTPAPYVRLRETLLAVCAVALLAFLLGTSLLAKRLTRPILDLVEGVRRVGHGRYATRVTVQTRDELGALAEGFNRMVGEIASREQQITSLAYHDALTGMPNRASFVKSINADLAVGKLGRGVVLVASLARLHNTSLHFGFAVADGLVKAAAQRIQGREDWRVASLGGHSFALFCPLASGQERDVWEGRLRAVLEAPLEWQGQFYDLGIHVGSALCPEDGREAETLLRRAGLAMQHGLPTVGAHVPWQPQFDVGGVQRLALLNDLREGIEAGQLLACYQPKARLGDGRVVACEMLLRWRHAEQGLLLPHDFIPAAEHAMLLRPLTQWVIDTAAAQAASWRAAGREMVVGINLSARNLADQAVVEQIANALARHDLPPEVLSAEITEGALMDDPETALAVVNAIAALGVKLCLDDFGTGYSSLVRLAHMPVSELKIDRSIVQRMLDSSREATVVKSSIDLAHALGMTVSAEGVETPEHWQRLLSYGCDLAQGHYLSRPIEAAAFDAWLAEREA